MSMMPDASGIPTFGGDKLEPDACAPMGAGELPPRPVRAQQHFAADGWSQGGVVGPDSHDGASWESYCRDPWQVGG